MIPLFDYGYESWFIIPIITPLNEPIIIIHSHHYPIVWLLLYNHSHQYPNYSITNILLANLVIPLLSQNTELSVYNISSFPSLSHYLHYLTIIPLNEQSAKPHVLLPQLHVGDVARCLCLLDAGRHCAAVAAAVSRLGQAKDLGNSWENHGKIWKNQGTDPELGKKTMMLCGDDTDEIMRKQQGFYRTMRKNWRLDPKTLENQGLYQHVWGKIEEWPQMLGNSCKSMASEIEHGPTSPDTLSSIGSSRLTSKDYSFIILLVGGFNHFEKIVNGKDYPIYYGKNMFETTNQFWVFAGLARID